MNGMKWDQPPNEAFQMMPSHVQQEVRHSKDHGSCAVREWLATLEPHEIAAFVNACRRDLIALPPMPRLGPGAEA